MYLVPLNSVVDAVLLSDNNTFTLKLLEQKYQERGPMKKLIKQDRRLTNWTSHECVF